MRTIIIENKKLKKLIIKKGELVDKGRLLSKEITKLTEERNKLGLEIQKVKDKVLPIITKMSDNIKLGEFEDVGNIEIVNDEVVMTVHNALEEFKKRYDEIKKEMNGKQNRKQKEAGK